jgi:hypothetical protein
MREANTMSNTERWIDQAEHIVKKDEDGIYVVQRGGGKMHYCLTLLGAIAKAKRLNRRLAKQRKGPTILWEPKATYKKLERVESH